MGALPSGHSGNCMQKVLTSSCPSSGMFPACGFCARLGWVPQSSGGSKTVPETWLSLAPTPPAQPGSQRPVPFSPVLAQVPRFCVSLLQPPGFRSPPCPSSTIDILTRHKHALVSFLESREAPVGTDKGKLLLILQGPAQMPLCSVQCPGRAGSLTGFLLHSTDHSNNGKYLLSAPCARHCPKHCQCVNL